MINWYLIKILSIPIAGIISAILAFYCYKVNQTILADIFLVATILVVAFICWIVWVMRDFKM